jgi:hypothetical protein
MNKYTLGFDLRWGKEANEILKTNQYIIKHYDKIYLYFYQISIFIEEKQHNSMYDCFLYTSAYNQWSDHIGTKWDIEMFKEYYQFNTEISEKEAQHFLSMSPKKIIKLKELASKNITNHIYELKENHPEWFI